MTQKPEWLLLQAIGYANLKVLAIVIPDYEECPDLEVKEPEELYEKVRKIFKKSEDPDIVKTRMKSYLSDEEMKINVMVVKMSNRLRINTRNFPYDRGRNKNLNFLD